ncbi:hypothetical protein BU26DRAFT_515640 [Trematosphaeria pertusa]|uniref:HTH araC/xylS-type domain-containing protein n=1 Tax=Trematosphaeria pertusa TaxID=390896 RepID=A0A6A6IRW1_9PLEO|nr:uncharacterized protein BU26DRAFT_515640 [Trematosphaeria pertusa]KAF2253274.1 hypothetical protein BU26DRAFT_515640 [Trematosphaeria pertusa]
MSFTTDAARWRALTIRDANANGQFVYTVKSTMIYCKPTCPARLARRANIGFCGTAAEAEAAGFRACKRCKPDVESNDDPQERAVAKACSLIEEALKEDDAKSFRLQDLAKSVGLTPRYFHKIFKDKTGLTPKEYTKFKMSKRDGATVDLALQESPIDLEGSNLDDFNFNDLVDFDMDIGASLPLDDVHAITALEAPVPSMFGQEVDVNIQTQAWNGTYGPDALYPGTGLGNDKLNYRAGITPITDLAKLVSDLPMTAVTSTFELDAAFILGGDMLLDLDGGMMASLV